MNAYRAVILGLDKFFRAEVDFEVDEAAGGIAAADEEADRIALLLQPAYGRLEVDSLYEITRPRP